MHTRLVYIL